MNPKLIFFLILIFAVLLEVTGDFYFKKWSTQNKIGLIFLGFLFYTLGSLFWAASLKYELLSKAGLIFMILNIILITLMSIFYFNEQLSVANKIGIGLGIISIILLEL